MKTEELKEFSSEQPIKIQKKNGFIYYGWIEKTLIESIKFRNRDKKIMIIDASEISAVEEVDAIKEVRR